ncbi:putative O-acetyl transferase [Pleurotus pulmonarius]|nr:putative O-acetyl transferase [Pleurotus pulmonarius]KAF4592774.1 putative O-acetyl transferase [Pleurotus pulmonarius]KAF4593669.1 putative O-acetyl transferase [Pleurotus pulmonarius]
MSASSVPTDTTEFERMMKCESYHAGDPYIRKVADEQAVKLNEINAEADVARRSALLKDFFKVEGDETEKNKARVIIVPPFFCEYGFNITVGGDLFIHKGCTILDVGPVRIGARTLIGPNVQIYTPTHPLSPEERNGLNGPEASKPISIGKDCWIGGGTIILPGVTIGDGVTKLWGEKKVAKRAPRAASAGTPRPKATPRRRLAAAPPLVPHFHIPATPSVRDLLAQHYGATPVKAEPAA